VNFVEMRKHPASAKLVTVMRGDPAWKAFSTIDPVRDLDWMIRREDDMVVHYAITDEAVAKAIERVASPYDIHVNGVRAWKGHVTYGETVFLRTAPNLVVIVPSEHADRAARDLAAHAPAAPAFHANEVMRIRAVAPARRFTGVPEDMSEARIWIDSRATDGGADVYGEGDCPNADAAKTDAAALASFVREKNSFAVRLITAGLLNHVEVTPSGNQVKMHVDASAAQIEAVMNAVASQYGATP
jgi:hypothetical protein